MTALFRNHRVGATLLALACGSCSPAMNGPGPSDASLIRARRAEPEGTRMFNIHCASCHGELGNAPGIVALLGPTALTEFRDDIELFEYTSTEMPPEGKAADLSEEEHWAVVRYLIQANR